MVHASSPISFSTQFWPGKMEQEPAIYPFCTEEILRPGAWQYQNPKIGQDFLILTLLLSGEMEYHFPHEKLILRPKQLLTIPPFMRYSFYATQGYHKLVLEFSGASLIHELNLLKLETTTVRKISQGEQEYWSAAIREIALMLQHVQEKMPQLLGKTMELLYRLDATTSNETEDDRLFQKAQGIIDNSLDIPIDLTLLQSQMRISRASLGRLFQKYAGISPRTYWIGRKMHRAKYLLAHTEFSIKEIAALLGYSSQFHFSCEFSKNIDYAPLVYRKNHKNAQA